MSLVGGRYASSDDHQMSLAGTGEGEGRGMYRGGATEGGGWYVQGVGTQPCGLSHGACDVPTPSTLPWTVWLTDAFPQLRDKVLICVKACDGMKMSSS